VEVILIDDVDGLGKKGATVKVKNGYARNFLVPRKLAIPTGDKAARVFQAMAKQNEIAKDKSRKAAEALAARYRGVEVEASARAGEDGTMFGSITASDIAELLGKQGLVTDRKKIVLDEAIKTLGDHPVHVKFDQGVTAEILVRVVAAS
jgi:large subunit ribosomal protein L9